MMDWLMAQDTQTVVLLAGGLGVLAMLALVLTVRLAWRSVDPPYEAVRRRPRALESWHVDPVQPDPATEVHLVLEPRRSLDPDWRARVLEEQPQAPAKHRHAHVGEETRAWDPEVLKRTIRQARERDGG